jgi:putative glutamine amidotransferase
VGITSVKANPAKYDGLVIPGGGDVDPALYGQKKNRHDFGINRKLDLLQFKLIRKFAKANKPVLGICRGAQVINVAFGGTLYQHIKGWHERNRKVKIAKGSWLYNMFGSVETTYHSHHQCALKLGKGIKATQWDAKDGRIEAIEHVEYPVYGLQWHPEDMGRRGARVARSFAHMCSKYSTPRKASTA